jgi:hypothetical protein
MKRCYLYLRTNADDGRDKAGLLQTQSRGDELW